MCIRDRIYTTCIRPLITYAHPILLTTETNKLDAYRIAERRALRLIYRRPPITKTPNTTLYALNKHFPDLDTFLHKINWKYAQTVNTRPTLQTLLTPPNRPAQNARRSHFLLNRLLTLTDEPPPKILRRKPRNRRVPGPV